MSKLQAETTSIMSLTFDIFTTTHRGGSDGTHFDDSPPPGDIPTSVITKIVVWHLTYIVGLEVRSDRCGIAPGYPLMQLLDLHG